MAALNLLTISGDGKSTPSVSDASAAFQAALGHAPSGSLTAQEMGFLHKMATWSLGSSDLARVYTSMGPTGLALLTQVFRNADEASSLGLPQAASTPSIGNSVKTWSLLCNPVNSGNVLIAVKFQNDKQRLGWMLATRAACEARSTLLSSAVQGQIFVEMLAPDNASRCEAMVSSVLPPPEETFADLPEKMIDQVKRGFVASNQDLGEAKMNDLALSCVLDGLNGNEPGKSLAASMVLSASGSEAYDLFVASQLRWGIGVEPNLDFAEKWLQRAAGEAEHPGTLPDVINQWTQTSWLAIKG